MNKRKLIWARNSVATALPAAASASAIDLLATYRTLMGITANLPGTTVMRLRMDLFAANLSAGGAPFWVGVRKATLREVTEMIADPAYVLGVAPQREFFADWMVWRAIYPNHGSDPVTGVPNASTYEVDTRAMRRLDESQETLVMILAKEISTGGYTVLHSESTLLALP